MFAGSLDRAAACRGPALAFRCGDEDVSWLDVRDRVACIAAGLVARGIGRGDRLATLLPNGLNGVELFAACLWTGVVVVPFNWRWTEAEVGDALADCGAKALVVDREFHEIGAAVTSRAGVLMIPADDRNAALLAAEPLPALNCATDDLLAIFYTGGTTGRSKGVMLSHGNVAYNALACMAEGMFGEDETYLHACPSFHIAGALGVYAAFVSASRNVVLPRFEAGAALAAVASERVTQSLLVPTMISLVLDHPDLTTTDTRSVRNILYGASPIAETLLDRAMAAFPQSAFTQLYGMTETSPTSTVLHSAAFNRDTGSRDRVRSTGRPIFGTQVRIEDDAGATLQCGAQGEIVVKGPGVMLGYWNRPAATTAALRDGWMRTGDGGSMDADGFLYLADRIKDMIITGGENVFSIEVENAVVRHPAVRQCAVVGVPHPRWGEAVHAVVVLHEGVRATERDIIEHCRPFLAGYKMPRDVTFQSDPLPMSAAGKILKQVLRERLGEK